MRTVPETLLAPENVPQVIADCGKLVDRQVADLSGVTGTAIKIAYKTVSAFDSGHIPAMIGTIIPSVAEALQPYWEKFASGNGEGARDFGDYLAYHGDEVTEALLSITDSRERASSRATIVKAYKTVRGSAAKHVRTALPDLGDLVQGYMQKGAPYYVR